MSKHPYKLVLDTNVIVAAARSRRGASWAVLSMVGTTEVEIALSVALALEYEQVLKRTEHQSMLSSAEADELVAFLCANARRCETIGRPWPLATDPGDESVARLAGVSGCDFLVTHNVRHFEPLERLGISVVTPSEFLRIIRSSS